MWDYSFKRYFFLVAFLFTLVSMQAQTAPANPVFVKYQGNVDNYTGVKQALVALPTSSVASIYDDATIQYNATTGLWEVKRDYRDWEVIMTQSSTSAPTVSDLVNELGGTPVWTHTATGVYTAELDDVFTPGSVFVDLTVGNATGLVGHAYSITDSTVVVKFYDAAGAAAELVGTAYLRTRVKQ